MAQGGGEVTWRQRTFKVNKQNWMLEKGVWQPVIQEEHVLKEIVFRLWHAAKIRTWRINCPVGGKVRPNEPGIPDLMGWAQKEYQYFCTKPCASCGKPCGMDLKVRVPLPLFIEVKRPGGAHRVAQERFIQEARSAGCVAFFAEGWNDVVREFGDCGIKLAN